MRVYGVKTKWKIVWYLCKHWLFLQSLTSLIKCVPFLIKVWGNRLWDGTSLSLAKLNFSYNFWEEFSLNNFKIYEVKKPLHNLWTLPPEQTNLSFCRHLMIKCDKIALQYHFPCLRLNLNLVWFAVKVSVKNKVLNDIPLD